MHIQPEAETVAVSDRPLWAHGAIDAVAAFIANRGRPVRALEFGSGGSSIFLLDQGANLITVEHHPDWAKAVEEKARERGVHRKLRLLRRDRPYAGVVDELASLKRFDLILVDGRDRVDCLIGAVRLLRRDGLLLLDDSQRARYWGAHQDRMLVPSVTFVDRARSTTLWHHSETRPKRPFIVKSFRVREAMDDDLPPDEVFVPRAFAKAVVTPTFSIRKPMPVRSPLEKELRAEGHIAAHATYLSPRKFTLRDAAVQISQGVKFIRVNGAVFRETDGRFIRTDDLSFSTDTPPLRLNGRTLDLTAAGAGRYAFFLLDSVPKFHVARKTGDEPHSFDHVLVNSGAPWVADVLVNRLGIERKKLVAFTKGAPGFSLDQSVHISGVRSARFTPDWVRRYLQSKRFRGPGTNPSAGECVYISRQRSDGRRVVNDEELKAALAPLGFREIFAEDYSIDEITNALRDARIVVSPHGAGLANILFCPRGCAVIELFGAHYTPQYKYLAEELGHRYVPIMGTDAEGQDVLSRTVTAADDLEALSRANLAAPCAEVMKTIQGLIARKSSNVRPPKSVGEAIGRYGE